jgi:hypothetical protein
MLGAVLCCPGTMNFRASSDDGLEGKTAPLEGPMKATLLTLAVLGAASTTAVADSTPKIDIQSLCKARSAADKMMNIPATESVADCIQDETTSKDKLDVIWSTTASSIRIRCRADAVVLGTLSYLDLLTCLQMADDVKWPSPATKTLGHRNK